jgi:cellulose synthase/poly-beta-1,6-N-acetylglucosamine synthase-like glycosyltransferase
VSSSFRDDARVTCFTKENGGKSRALNLGLEHAKGSIFIAIDADTIFDKDAIRLMVRYFADPQVAAVSGNVKVGNRGKIVTEWQHCEYVTGFNLERRAYSELNCITVVPGAIGAWRKDAALAEGGFKTDTLAEDTDMTLTLLEKGYRIAFEENARAYTETPETFRSLLKQRFRWTYGTLQCLWKHRHDLFSKKQKTLGFIAMPFMWIFQYIFQTLCPIVDIYMIFSILFGSSSENIILSYLAFLGVDIVTSLFAFRLEGEKLLPLLWMPIQRLAYRFIMAYIVLKSIGMAVIGKTVGWNKLKRTGSAANRA